VKSRWFKVQNLLKGLFKILAPMVPVEAIVVLTQIEAELSFWHYAHSGSFDMMMVPEAANMPPTP
jgi:hypothetical protein